jgi:hypothetical protein
VCGGGGEGWQGGQRGGAGRGRGGQGSETSAWAVRNNQTATS